MRRSEQNPNTTSSNGMGMHHVLAFCRRKSAASLGLQAYTDYSLPFLALPQELTASSNFWKELMIECKDKNGSYGSMIFSKTSGLTL